MAANMYGIDLGKVYSDVESIKGARTRNKLSSLQLSEAEREIAQRPQREANERGRVNAIADSRRKAVYGDEDAQKRLLTLDPEGGAKFLDAISKMDDRKLEIVKRTVDEIGQASSYVLQGKTPHEQERRYKTMYQGVSPEAQSKLPENYDPKFVEFSLAKATEMDKLLENPQAIKVGGQNVVYKGGREIERANIPMKEGSGSGGSGGLKSADESLMYRQSVELLGGIFDQAGNITNLDPTVRNKIQGIASEAVNIFQSGQARNRSEAVKMAAQKFGMTIPEGAGQEDPLGLRQ